jgi:AcrR family transcriptional regulator
MRYAGSVVRLTRAEAQARTRGALIDTATSAFLRDGYAATSLEKVADLAGYSKGAVYSNFRSKNELCLAVLDHIHAQQVHLIEQAMAGPATLEARLEVFREWAERTIGDPAWTGLECEFATHARNDPRVRCELARQEASVRDLLASVVTRTADELGSELPLPAGEAAAALLSLGIGLGVRRMVEPTTSVGVLIDVVAMLIGTSKRRP